MNKAFVKDGDSGSGDEIPEPRPLSTPGGKNYMTPAGAKRLQHEFHDLKHRLRPEITRIVSWAAGNGDRSENGDYIYNKKKLREIDSRLRYLSKRLQDVEIVDPKSVKADQVRFGATVTIEDEEGNVKTYSIVGVDEVDVEKGRISWMSPLASAMLKAREGDTVTFQSPKGRKEIEIVEIKYEELP